MDEEQLNAAAQLEDEESSEAAIEDNYRIIERLKKDGGGDALLAAAKDGGRLVVIKHVNAVDLVYNKMASFANQALPQIIYAKEDRAKGETTVIEEYLAGTTLNEWLKERELEPIGDEMAKRIFTQLAGGLAALHERGIIHRAISPQNVIFSDGQVKFVSFDHAILAKNAASAPLDQGCIGFAPPEQAAAGKASFRSDVYALGMTMQSLLSQNYKGRYAKVLKHCLAAEPEERYGSGTALLKAVQSAGTIPLTKIIVICAALYVFIFGGICLTNHFYNPQKQLESREAFEREQKAAEAEAAELELEKGINVDSNDSSAHSETGDMAKGKLSVSAAIPGKQQEENAGATVIHMGKASELTGTDSGDKVMFPNTTKLLLTIKNNTDKDITNPIIRIIPTNIDLAQVSDPPDMITKHMAAAVQYQRDISIAAGAEMKLEIPLGKAAILAPSGENSSLKVVLSSDNYANTAAKVIFAFN